MKLRDDGETEWWKLGEVEIVRQHGRLHLIFGRTLNVSVPAKDIVFHAGTATEVADAILSLAGEDRASVVEDFAGIGMKAS
jgi:hypothetical protein